MYMSQVPKLGTQTRLSRSRKTKLISKKRPRNKRIKQKVEIIAETHQSLSCKIPLPIKQYLERLSDHCQIPYSHIVSRHVTGTPEIFKHVLTCFLAVTQSQLNRQLEILPVESLFDLPTTIRPEGKTLFLDLDQTLIHTTTNLNSNHGSVQLTFDNTTLDVLFNIRPYCFEFLQNISKFYEIYIFTASESCYANALLDYLNRDLKTITGVLSRQSWHYIKDLRMVKNRTLQQMVLVDNLATSFGLAIDNGIPVLEFIDNSLDSELRFLQEYLLQIVTVADVREANRNRWKLARITQMDGFFQQILRPN